MIGPPSAFIDGAAVMVAGAPLPVIDPATEETIAEVAEADAALVNRAARAARRAFDEGRWRTMPVERRQEVLRRCATLIEDAVDELAGLETANTGIPIAQVRDRQIGRAAYNFRFFADYIGQSAGELYEQNPDYLTLVRREPVGVAALIAPWNAPIALGAMKIAAAIAFGNSCIIKPSEQAPLGIGRLVELLGAAGLPDGVLNLVNGRGHVTGEALVGHDEVDLVSFTGGTETGRRIMAAAGARLKPATMELGGKSANIVFDSADFEQALDGALLGIFTNNGQQCLAGSRILVQRGIADRFIEAFVARAKRLRIGHPLAAETDLGPLASRVHRDHVLGFVPAPGRRDARLLAGGRRADRDRGFYIEPTIVAVESNDHRICQNEIFGPFAALMTFDTPDEAYRIANATRFGLVSYVWSQHMATVMEAQERLQSGVVWCNMPMMRELRAPFGGFKDSGAGAEGGRACEDFYTRRKTVSLPRRPTGLRKLGA